MKHAVPMMKHIAHNAEKSFAMQKRFILCVRALRSNNRGFSLMEVLVVMSVVVIGLLGVASLSTQNMQVQNLNDEELVASMLAQEGIELTRNIRDWNWINLPWDSWKTNIINGSNFIVDYGPGDATVPVFYDSAYTDSSLYIDGNNFYSHDSSGTKTKFQRHIETSDIDGAVKVLCHVNWRSGGRNHSYDIESHLYPWR